MKYSKFAHFTPFILHHLFRRWQSKLCRNTHFHTGSWL